MVAQLRYSAVMNVDRILGALNEHGVAYMLIGGMNYLLRHEPVITLDVDLWIEDTADNRARCEEALKALDAEWGPTDDEWGAVARKTAGWLSSQPVFCLASPSGAIDVFRIVQGLESWSVCRERAVEGKTAAGVPYVGISDRDMLASQEALPASEQKPDRIRALRRLLEGAS